MNKIESVLAKSPIIPVVVIHNPAHAVPLANCLTEAGISIIEITLRTDGALDAIHAVSENCPECCVGAGTVIDYQQIEAVKAAGAQFLVSPGTTMDLVETAAEQDLPLLPGAVTCSEIIAAMDLGCTALKFFPANLFGGVDALRAYASLFPNMQFCPTGGVNQQNLADYLSLPNVPCVGGSWIVPTELIEAENWNEIRQRAAHAVANLESGDNA